MENTELKTEEHPVKQKKGRASLWTMINEHRMATFFGTVLSIWGIVLAYYSIKVDIQEVMVGFIPASVYDKSDLEDKYLLQLKGPNTFLRNEKSGYRLVPKIADADYEQNINQLNENKIQIAFVSQCLSAVIQHKHIYEDIVCIGYKKSNNRSIYHTGIIYHKRDAGFLQDVFRLFKGDGAKQDAVRKIMDSVTIVLNSQELSTSSHVIPEVFLMGFGINLRKDKQHLSKSRVEMRNMIKQPTNGHIIGFMSNEDYQSISEMEKSGLGFEEIDVPIPYEDVYVNRSWWEGSKLSRLFSDCLDESNRKLLIRALHHPPFGFIDIHGQENLYDSFRKYTFSGVVYKVVQDTGYVQMPDPELDLFGLDTISNNQSIHLLDFSVENKSTESNYTLRQSEIGTARLFHKNGNFVVVKKGIKIGMRVLR